MKITLQPIIDFAPADAGLILNNIKGEGVAIISLEVELYENGIIAIECTVDDLSDTADAIANAIDNV